MDNTYSIASAREQLADLINQAAYAGKRPILTRRGRPVAAIVPIEDLERLENQVPPAPDEVLNIVVARSDDLVGICRRHQVKELALFGSALRADFDTDSDVDLLVEFLPDAKIGFIELGQLEEELAALFDRAVDLVPKGGLRPILREEILSTARVIYAA